MAQFGDCSIDLRIEEQKRFHLPIADDRIGGLEQAGISHSFEYLLSVIAGDGSRYVAPVKAVANISLLAEANATLF
jgi:hypothetical protein